MLFKNYLNSLSRFQIFQLYFIISVCILFPYFKILEIKDEKTYTHDNLIQVNKNIKNIKEKIILPKPIKVLKSFEKEAKNYKTLNIKDFSINKNSLNLKGVSNQIDFFNFLVFCENYSVTSRLSSISLKPIEKTQLYSFSFSIKFKKKYLAQISKEKTKEIENKILALSSSKEKPTIKLQAILNTQVIINDKFLSIGDSFNNYKIEKILNDHIIVSKDSFRKKFYLKEALNDL